MHILYIHQYFATPHGKTGTRSYEFAKRWVAAGHRVTMLTSVAQLTPADLKEAAPGRVRRFTVEGMDVVAVSVAYHQTMSYSRRVWAFLMFAFRTSWLALRVPRVDIVYATSTPLTVGVPALAAKWFHRRPFVFEVRDVWPAIPIAMGVIRNRFLISLLRWFERTIYRNARVVVALSPGMAEAVRSAGPPTLPIVTVPNAADLELFHPQVDGGVVRRKMGWEERFVCLHTGTMGAANGLDILLRAAAYFRSDSEVLFVLVGEGREKARLVEEKNRLQLDNLLILAATSKNELPAMVAASDLCLVTFASVPILEHNSANKFFDYLSAGKPILLNYGGWQRELLESTGAGLGCRMGNDAGYFAALARLKADRRALGVMGANARKLAEQQFHRDLLADQVLAALCAALRA